MNVSSPDVLLPTHHRLINFRDPSLYASPIAVRNKIKAIQSRKARLTVPSYYESTTIRPFQTTNGNGMMTSATSFSVITAERLVDRSKEFRLDRIPVRQSARPSIDLNPMTTHQSPVCPNLQPSSSPRKTTSAALNRSRSSIGHVKETTSHHHSRRETSAEQRTFHSPALIESRPKSTLKIQPSPTQTNPRLQKGKHFHPICPNEENLDFVDEQFQEYFERAMTKCADWLMKYFFNEESE